MLKKDKLKIAEKMELKYDEFLVITKSWYDQYLYFKEKYLEDPIEAAHFYSLIILSEINLTAVLDAMSEFLTEKNFQDPKGEIYEAILKISPLTVSSYIYEGTYGGNKPDKIFRYYIEALKSRDENIPYSEKEKMIIRTYFYGKKTSRGKCDFLETPIRSLGTMYADLNESVIKKMFEKNPDDWFTEDDLKKIFQKGRFYSLLRVIADNIDLYEMPKLMDFLSKILEKKRFFNSNIEHTIKELICTEKENPNLKYLNFSLEAYDKY